MIKVTAPVRIDISAGWSDADPFRGDFGGAVLNAAIDLRVLAFLSGKNLVSSLGGVPGHSGLGTSGAIRTVYIVAANPLLIRDKKELVRRVHVFENAIVGQRAGFQDQAAAIYGGVNYWEFWRDGSIHRVPISRGKAKHLYDRLILVYTGDRHQSANVHEKVFNQRQYMKKIPIIDRMKDIAKDMSKHIANEKAMTDLINETWLLQKSLYKGIETPMMTRLQMVCRDCYLAARATGAGGGGCMLFYLKPEMRNGLIRQFNAIKRKYPNVKVLPFKFDYKGIVLKKN
jgi:D-glycero-alpha-D-manno-heptose-7-phosphate kinase